MASPPHVPQLNIPRKRSSISGSVTGGTAKKRKPSQLRNSFAPTSDSVGSPLRYSRSPSADSVATTSVANGAGGRKRKRKNDDALSITGSSMRGGRRGDARSATGVDAGENEEDDGEDEDADEEMDAVLEGGKVTEATKKQEKEHERYVITPTLPNFTLTSHFMLSSLVWIDRLTEDVVS